VPRVLSSELAGMAGRSVELAGWVHRRRPPSSCFPSRPRRRLPTCSGPRSPSVCRRCSTRPRSCSATRGGGPCSRSPPRPWPDSVPCSTGTVSPRYTHRRSLARPPRAAPTSSASTTSAGPRTWPSHRSSTSRHWSVSSSVSTRSARSFGRSPTTPRGTGGVRVAGRRVRLHQRPRRRDGDAPQGRRGHGRCRAQRPGRAPARAGSARGARRDSIAALHGSVGAGRLGPRRHRPVPGG
jgi:hypothetical protein